MEAATPSPSRIAVLTALVLGGALALGQPTSPPTDTPTQPAIPPQAGPLVVPAPSAAPAVAQPGLEQPPPAQNIELALPQLAPPPPATPPPAPPAAPNQWPLMRLLQGTWYGAVLEDRRISVYGWTEMSYNASTASHSNNPVFMDDWANAFLLNQNWVHIERTIDTSKHEL